MSKTFVGSHLAFPCGCCGSSINVPALGLLAPTVAPSRTRGQLTVFRRRAYILAESTSIWNYSFLRPPLYELACARMFATPCKTLICLSIVLLTKAGLRTASIWFSIIESNTLKLTNSNPSPVHCANLPRPSISSTGLIYCNPCNLYHVCTNILVYICQTVIYKQEKLYLIYIHSGNS